MTIRQFKLMLCDSFVMDMYIPPLNKAHINEFRKMSYAQWALDELTNYISNAIAPQSACSVSILIKLTNEFRLKMQLYSVDRPQTYLIFNTAYVMSNRVLDLLRSIG